MLVEPYAVALRDIEKLAVSLSTYMKNNQHVQ